MNKDQERILENNQRYEKLVDNVLMSRAKLLEELLGNKRDIAKECDYKRELRVEDYLYLYEREPIGARVVEAWPSETWKSPPLVFEDENLDVETPFEMDFKRVGQSLRGPSWFEGSEGNPFWEVLSRADKLSGLGHFGVILLGFDDGDDLSKPVAGMDVKAASYSKEQREKLQIVPVMNEGSPRELLYMRAFGENLVQIDRWEEDSSSPRYGHPLFYNITLSDFQSSSSAGTPNKTVKVHWTRAIHLADNLGASEVIAAPRMRAVYNRVYDLWKLYGGSAEMYWKGAFPGLSIESHPQLGGDVQLSSEDKAAFKEQIQKYDTGLQRVLMILGMHANQLAPTVVDPTPQINTQIESICIKIEMPKRIFMGSERGELASSQDKKQQNDKTKDRQNNYATPRIIVPTIDRLILAGVCRAPEESYVVQWPDPDALTEGEQADVAVKETAAIAQYVQSGAESLIPPREFFVHILRKSEEVAEAIIDAAMEQSEEDLLTKSPSPQPGFDEFGNLVDPNTGLRMEGGKGKGVDGDEEEDGDE